MEITFWGHACVQIEAAGYSVICDPYITDNALCLVKDLSQFKVDGILVSHGHHDHLGDAVALAKANDALVVGVAEMAGYIARQGAKTHAMHIGGAHQFDFGWVKVTPAWHGSSVTLDGQGIYTGNPCGFLYRAEGKTVYFAGDTGLFGDMELIGKLNPIDVAFLPIGDNYVMGIDDAVYAAKLLQAKLTVPMHYNTFPLITQDPQEFKDKLAAENLACQILAPGEKLTL